MSSTVTISRDVEVTVASVECDVRNHGGLGFNVEAERDGSLRLTVDPCEECLLAAKEEGKAEGPDA